LITGENCHGMYAEGGQGEGEKCKKGEEQDGTAGLEGIVLNGR